MDITTSKFKLHQKLRMLIEDCEVHVAIAAIWYDASSTSWRYVIVGRTSCGTVNDVVDEKYLIDNTF